METTRETFCCSVSLCNEESSLGFLHSTQVTRNLAFWVEVILEGANCSATTELVPAEISLISTSVAGTSTLDVTGT